MNRVVAALSAGAVALAGVASTSAQVPATAQRVLQSDGAYHVGACPGPAAAGYVRCHAQVLSDRSGAAVVNRYVASNLERTGANATPAGYGPRALNSAYNPAVLPTYPVGVGSRATTIAVIDAFGYANAEADLQVYRNTYHLPACTSANGCFAKYNQAGQTSNYPIQRLGWAQQSALDLDMASAMCPQCRIILVEANTDLGQNLIAAVNTAVAKGAHVVNNSWGGPEAGTASFNAAFNRPGVAMTASAGDYGYGDGPQFPATSQYVTAVGGTRLVSAANARGWSETVWPYTGSGCSRIYPKPQWQAFIPLCTRRMEADVSAVASPGTGVAVYAPVSGTRSAWQVYGGTGAAAPIVAGLYGANGKAVTPGSLYATGVKFNDVTVGANGNCGGLFFCNARKGYDGPTGLGTPTGEAGF